MAALSACTAIVHPFAPPQSFDTSADIKALEKEFGVASSITGYYAGQQTKATRNQFISGRLALINLQYIRFIRKFAADKAQINSALDLMQLGVDLAITTVGGAGAKAALGAASAGITGTRSTVDKNFFYEKTVPALITAMNAARKEGLIPIIRGMRSPLENYPFAQAVSDLEAYYFAGTFVGGLQAIQRDAGAKDEEAEAEIRSLSLQGPVPQGVQSRRVSASNYVWNLDENNETEKLRRLANALGVPEGENARDGILDRITLARTPEEIERIEQAIEVIEGQ